VLSAVLERRAPRKQAGAEVGSIEGGATAAGRETCAMNGEGLETWEGARSGEGQGPDEREVVEVVLSWGDARSRTVLAVAQVNPGGTLSLGESGELLVPAEVLGAERAEIVRYEPDCAVAFAPRGSRLRVDGFHRDEECAEIVPGHVVELFVGPFVVRLARVRAARRVAGAPLEDLRRSGAGFIFGSAVAHLAAFAAVALFTPALGATEEDQYDPDRLALMQHLLNARAAAETERPESDDAPAQTGGDSNAGAAARGAQGALGRPEAHTEGRWAARGNARPEDVTLPRERALAEAAQWGLIGMLPSLAGGDPNVPVVPWGKTLQGADDVSAAGHLYGGTIGDAFGNGLGLAGPDEGGGGRADAIGLRDIGPLGHTGTCFGPGPCDGIGDAVGRTGRPHTPRFKGPRYETVQTNGHLPAEVIQRIVRQNDGRYRFCYENGLKTNPNLQGRVTVRFLIDRGGAVAVASDAGSDIPDEAVRRCVVSSFTALSFPAPDSGVVTVVYPIVFSPQ
jgi:hypothetical protein